MIPVRRIFAIVIAVSAAFMAGCASEEPVQAPSEAPVTEVTPGESVPAAAVEAEVVSEDLASAADKMAAGIVAIPEIAGAASTPRILLEPVTNNTSLSLDRDMFLARVRILLNERAVNKARFLDHAMMEAIAPHQPDFILAGRLDAASAKSRDGEDLVLYSFRLTSARTGEIIWENGCEIKRESLESE